MNWKIILGSLLVTTLLAFASPALAAHDEPEGDVPDDDIVFANCQDPKNSILRAGRRMECDLEAARVRICDDGSVIHLLEEEAEFETCTVTPYHGGVWRPYNDIVDDPWLELICEAGTGEYVCVGSPPHFKP